MTACRPWLAAEVRRVNPELIVALGATAGKSLLGSSFRVTEARGTLVSLEPGPDMPLTTETTDHSADRTDRTDRSDRSDRSDRDHHHLLSTVHPSAVLRAKDRDEAYGGLVDDLRIAARFLG